MKFYGKAKETGDLLFKAFEENRVPSALAPIFIRHNSDRYCSCWSWTNQLLVALSGYCDARTYKGWQEVGRQVRRGEKALYILEPVRVAKEDEVSGEKVRITVGFKVGPRFGLEQTDGDPLPGFEEQERFVNSLPLLAVARHWGLSVSTYNGASGKAHGYYRTSGGIALGVENLSTWAHELVHAADDRLGSLKESGQHWRSETVAELGGCILLHMIGEPEAADDGGAWRYIERYAERNDLDPLAACLKVLDRTCAAVTLILDEADAVDTEASPFKETGLDPLAKIQV